MIERTNERICSGLGFSSSLFSAKRTAKNSDKTAGAPLLFLLSKLQKPRISAKNAEPLAVNFPP
jgi:hypothetical protein